MKDAGCQGPIIIMAFPRSGNSYSDCFYSALEARGVKVVEGEFSGMWLLRNFRNVDYVHVHWPSLFYSDSKPTRSLWGFTLFLFFLGLAWLRGARLIWTIHNLYPHDPCVIPQLDAIARWLLVKVAAVFFVHGRAAGMEALRAFPSVAGRIVRIEHGHWVGHYPNSITRSIARKQLNLSSNGYVFLFLGLCRPYKNLDGLIRSFEQLPGEPTLVISGKFPNPKYEAKIRAAIRHSPARIILHSGFVPDQHLQMYFAACDAVVTPYQEILSSGSAILAMSFARPVVAPAMGALKDLISDGCGVLYDPAQPEGLRDAMREATEKKFDEAQILETVLRLDWRTTAKTVVQTLLSLRDSKHLAARHFIEDVH